MTIKREFFYSAIITALVMVLAHNYHFYVLLEDPGTQKKVSDLIMAFVSILGAFLGFVIAAVSIIATVLNFPIFRRLHDTHRTSELISKFMWLVWITALALAVTIATVFTFPAHKYVTLGVGTFTLTFWFMVFFHSMRLFEAVLHKAFNQ